MRTPLTKSISPEEYGRFVERSPCRGPITDSPHEGDGRSRGKLPGQRPASNRYAGAISTHGLPLPGRCGRGHSFPISRSSTQHPRT
jgi:hypothetical protein